MSRLDEILAHKRAELAARKALTSLADVRAAAGNALPPLDFKATIRRPLHARPRLIAEIKRASPSRGLLAGADFDPLRLAQAYRDNGASAFSVLTDERFFGGNLEHLRQVAALQPRRPVLRKDFILEESQIYEARAAGASAILLIVACLEFAQLGDFSRLAEELGMAALVEVHNLPELEVALKAGAQIIGINNRDLRTFEVRLETTLRLRPHIPPGVVVVAESGIHTRADADVLAEAGVDALLVGEALVAAQDTAAKVRELVG
ncbi:MAG TPA: indole-3-glycerol phosphate synthase TrpC [Anaerolinea thermolimosa]|uniref:Indole-3-glycerol phosphate synthase n=1 Tax=Anaerolinea thermolimosa TaxID=229919 RepID=A0A3D1JEZ1_9CHLR|nr:indole-3-glycerol phosphate synthase TrpC [Anaerolinea thermolimosa]